MHTSSGNEQRQAAMAAIKAVVEDGGRSMDEKAKSLQEMSAAGMFDPIGGSHQSHLVLNEAMKKIREPPPAPPAPAGEPADGGKALA